MLIILVLAVLRILLIIIIFIGFTAALTFFLLVFAVVVFLTLFYFFVFIFAFILIVIKQLNIKVGFMQTIIGLNTDDKIMPLFNIGQHTSLTIKEVQSNLGRKVNANMFGAAAQPFFFDCAQGNNSRCFDGADQTRTGTMCTDLVITFDQAGAQTLPR